MRWRCYIAAVICMAIVGCGVDMQQYKKRTIVGVSAQQALVNAQHALAMEGLDLEEIDFEKGVIKSTWKKKNRRQIQYVITVSSLMNSPAASSDTGAPNTAPPAAAATTGVQTTPAAPAAAGAPQPSASQAGAQSDGSAVGAGTSVVDVTVSANVKEKKVGGWTEPKVSRSARAERLLDDIVEAGVVVGTGNYSFIRV